MICFESGFSYYESYFLWVLIGITFIMLAACMGEYISRDAEGAGFSEVKAILGGLDMPNFLAPRTYVAKFLGIVLA